MVNSRETSRIRLGNRSRSRPSRIPGSRNTSAASAKYFPHDPEELINPDGQIGEQEAELLHELVHPHRYAQLIREEPEDESPSDEEEEEATEGFDANWRDRLPWWKRPSPLWILCMIPISSIAMSATIAPRVEIYTRLVCDAFKPEYTIGTGTESLVPTISSALAIDDKTYELCAADPIVQKAVAKLSLVMASSMGLLSCLTTAWWGSMSDRLGRTRVMSYAVMGVLVTDINFIIVAKYWQYLPGGYWFLIVGPIMDGCLGGVSTITSAINAYITDCVEPTRRSRIFSLFMGLLYSGMSVGPTLASLLISYTGTALTIFYITVVIHILYACAIFFLVPESLSPQQMAQSRKLYREEQQRQADARAKGGVLAWLRSVVGFTKPLALLLPAAEQTNPLKKPKRDYRLMLLALAQGCSFTLIGSISYKMQYMILTFGWTSKQLGYWTSILGTTRAIFLTLILPTIMHLIQRRKPAIQLPIEVDEPLGPPATIIPEPETEPEPVHERDPSVASLHSRHHSPSTDLNLARVSILVEIVAYSAMGLTSSGLYFTAFSAFGALGSGLGPAANSVASALYAQQGGTEAGKLFGALSVVQVICSQVIGPFLYGSVFMRTVGTLPRAIFCVSVGALTLSFMIWSCIRLTKPAAVDVEEQQAAAPPPHPPLHRENTVVGVEDDEVPLVLVDVEDGRTRKVPDTPEL